MAAKTYDTNWVPRDATAAAVRRFEESFTKEMGFAPRRGATGRKLQVIPTGSIDLDAALKIGGYPLGRLSQLWGAESTGKTSLCLLAVASAQRTYPSKIAAWVDPEATFDEDWATQLGVDLDRLWLVKEPKTAELAADSYRRLVESGQCSIAVLDSIGALTSRKEFEKLAAEETVALVARIVSRLVGQVTSIGQATGTALLVVNQIRSNLGGYGSPTTLPGGHRLQFATSARIHVKRGGEPPKTVKLPGEESPVPVSYEMALKVDKLKCGPHGSVAHPWLINRATKTFGGVGLDQAEEAVTFGLRVGAVIQGGGGYYELPWEDPERAGASYRVRGKDRAVAALRARPDEIARIRERVVASLADQVKEIEDQVEEIEDPDPHGLSEVEV